MNKLNNMAKKKVTGLLLDIQVATSQLEKYFSEELKERGVEFGKKKDIRFFPPINLFHSNNHCWITYVFISKQGFQFEITVSVLPKTRVAFIRFWPGSQEDIEINISIPMLKKKELIDKAARYLKGEISNVSKLLNPNGSFSL